MDIQAITINSVEDCAPIFIQAYNQPPWNYQWERENAVKYLTEYASSAQFVGFAVYDKGHIAGALFAHSKTWWTNNQLFIDELFIAPDFQKRGFGKILINHAEQYALKNGMETIALMTNKFMPSMHFYNNHHFIHAQQFIILFKNI
jgi:aminoglycoside 6'-N-acetyltransferase I